MNRATDRARTLESYRARLEWVHGTAASTGEEAEADEVAAWYARTAAVMRWDVVFTMIAGLLNFLIVTTAFGGPLRSDQRKTQGKTDLGQKSGADRAKNCRMLPIDLGLKNGWLGLLRRFSGPVTSSANRHSPQPNFIGPAQVETLAFLFESFFVSRLLDRDFRTSRSFARVPVRSSAGGGAEIDQA